MSDFPKVCRKCSHKTLFQLFLFLIICVLALATLALILVIRPKIQNENGLQEVNKDVPFSLSHVTPSNLTPWHLVKGSPRYYFLVGECPEQVFSHHKAFLDSRQWLERLQEAFPHWKIHTLAIDRWLAPTHQHDNYTHEALIDFTRRQLPELNTSHDKFQWIISVDCSKIYGHIKSYYSTLYKQQQANGLSAQRQYLLDGPPLPMDYPNELDNLLADKSARAFRHAIGIMPPTNTRYLNRWINNSYWDINIQ
ncbi:hypothetical protein RFI_23454 [Reticulomyxa filosa]|uniref:Uncharacterized protein n=1 Tax=Reticulomyxa filosa TaxID=46433 RepID=X6MJA2_RETFI|nr:hypothetical protein RFI_23454 [Reticulomyxa filosa]|eukprot:ETO13914.1 hypothetical protein RFI_23454 [Reticulomyxa filosa]